MLLAPLDVPLDVNLVVYVDSVKLLDWGEEGHRTDAEIASLRAAFTQEVVVWYKLDHPNVTKVILFVVLGFSIWSKQ